MSTPDISRYADAIMAEIGKDIAAGQVPSTVASFSELHGYVDANDYASQVIPESAAPSWDAWMELANTVEAEVTERLRARTR